MTDEEFLRSMRCIADAHINNLTTAHSVLSHSTAALVKVAVADGVPADLIRDAIGNESIRVNREVDEALTLIAQRRQRARMH